MLLILVCILQGIGAACIMSNDVALVRATYPANARQRHRL